MFTLEIGRQGQVVGDLGRLSVERPTQPGISLTAFTG
jgi:hypothetical protein